MKWLDDLKTRLRPKTPAEREKLKKLMVITALILSCLVCLWLIFAPSGEDETNKGKANTELPDGTTEGMPDTKIKAYEQEDMKKEKEQQRATIDAISTSLDTVTSNTPDTVPNSIENSANAYQQAQASLQSFYVPDYSPQQSEEVAQLQDRIAELEMQQSMAQQQPTEEELMEKSYQMAAKLMNGGQSPETSQSKEEQKGKREVQPVAQVQHNVVSTLSASSEGKGFNTSVGAKRKTNGKNTIAAVIAGNQSVTNGQAVKLRTEEPMWVGSRYIPRHATVVGIARLSDERLGIEITSLEYDGSIYEVDLAVYDADGQEGINIPNSMENDALHEIGANMGSTMGSTINLSTNAGAQIASDVGKGLINGVSQYITKKMRRVKVHLKAGYKVMLHQPEQN